MARSGVWIELPVETELWHLKVQPGLWEDGVTRQTERPFWAYFIFSLTQKSTECVIIGQLRAHDYTCSEHITGFSDKLCNTRTAHHSDVFFLYNIWIYISLCNIAAFIKAECVLILSSPFSMFSHVQRLIYSCIFFFGLFLMSSWWSSSTNQALLSDLTTSFFFKDQCVAIPPACVLPQSEQH